MKLILIAKGFEDIYPLVKKSLEIISKELKIEVKEKKPEEIKEELFRTPCILIDPYKNLFIYSSISGNELEALFRVLRGERYEKGLKFDINDENIKNIFVFVIQYANNTIDYYKYAFTLAEKAKDKNVKIFLVNIEDFPELALMYHFEEVPCIVIEYKDGSYSTIYLD